MGGASQKKIRFIRIFFIKKKIIFIVFKLRKKYKISSCGLLDLQFTPCGYQNEFKSLCGMQQKQFSVYS
jgi:hypothetical protein